MDCNSCPPKFEIRFPPCLSVYSGGNTARNPGNLENIHILANRIRPQFFDGLILDYYHRLAPNKMFTANWILSHNQPAGFRFGGIYSRYVKHGILETPTIQADINPSTLATNLGIIWFPFQCLRLASDFQRSGDEIPLQNRTTVEYSGDNTTLTLNLYNFNQEVGRTTLSCLQAINSHLALGGELLLEFAEKKSLMADVALAARYKIQNYALAATISRQGLDVSYWQRLHPRLQMASILVWQRKTNKGVGTICYKWDFDDAYVKGMLDSNLSVGFLYSKTIQNLPVSASMSLLFNLYTTAFVFGLKFVIDPSGLQRDH